MSETARTLELLADALETIQARSKDRLQMRRTFEENMKDGLTNEDVASHPRPCQRCEEIKAADYSGYAMPSGEMKFQLIKHVAQSAGKYPRL